MEVLPMKKYSKFAVRTLSLLLAAVLLFGPLSLGIEANAAAATKGTTTASLLFVRSGAGTNYKAVGSLWRGTSVDILEEKDGWYRIKDGWISAKYVKTDAPAAPSTPTTPSTPATPSTPSVPSTPPTESKTGNATVTASLLFIRKDPSTNYSAVGMLRKGERIQVLETNGNWLKIKDGWVYSAYVAMDNGSSVYTEKKTVVVTANELNIRESPSLLAKKVGSLKKNQSVEVLEVSGD